MKAAIDALVKKYGSYRAAGKAIGVPYPYLNRLRNGQHPSPSQATLDKILRP